MARASRLAQRLTKLELYALLIDPHQEISHIHRLSIEHSLEPFNKMKEICEALRSQILLIQTPPSLGPDRLEAACEFFEKTEGNLILVWETRGKPWEQEAVRTRLEGLLRKINISHVTDPLRILPTYVSQISYFRLHGLGTRMYYYQYTDKELEELRSLMRQYEDKTEKVLVFFNNLSMYEDARRFQYFLQNDKFPDLDYGTGMDSIRAIMGRTKYPSNKRTLIEKVGLRIIQLRNRDQIRLEELLKQLPSEKYGDAAQVMKSIEKTSPKRILNGSDSPHLGISTLTPAIPGYPKNTFTTMSSSQSRIAA